MDKKSQSLKTLREAGFTIAGGRITEPEYYTEIKEAINFLSLNYDYKLAINFLSLNYDYKLAKEQEKILTDVQEKVKQIIDESDVIDFEDLK